MGQLFFFFATLALTASVGFGQNHDTLVKAEKYPLLKKIDNSRPTALGFDGINDSLSLRKKPIRDEFTFSVWVKTDALKEGNMPIMGYPEFATLKTTPDRKIHLNFHGQGDLYSDPCLANGAWQHLAVSYSKNIASFYKNGRLVGSDTLKKRMKTMPDSAVFVLGKNNFRELFNGLIDQPEVFEGVLTQNQIAELHSKSKHTPQLTENLLAHFAMNSPSGELKANGKISWTEDSTGAFPRFSGKGEYLQGPKVETDYSFSVAAWIKPAKMTGSQALVDNNIGFSLKLNQLGGLTLTLPKIKDYISRRNLLDTGRWQHVAVTFEAGDSIRMFVNGKTESVFPAPIPYLPGKRILIGRNLWNETYHGGIRDVSIWNRKLEVAEVDRLFAEKPDLGKDKNVQKHILKFSLLTLIPVIGFMLIVFLKKNKADNTPNEKLSGPNKELENLRQLAENKLSDENYTTDQFAKDAGMSKTKLYYLLKENTGMSASGFLRDIRMKKVAELLQDPEISISEIIVKTGFQSRSYFNRCFKEQYGDTPSAYRKKRENPINQEANTTQI
ncbi:LamG-like jellyroll fold domain-containing protein [Fulvitalea axinellae]|uniref:LamG-like jellyroll fold domain-containing protein n=1 Tax=Fulvitalea axinellae TaxID=1182444 RepID=UPI0030CA3725